MNEIKISTVSDLIESLKTSDDDTKVVFCINGKIVYDYEIYETEDKHLGWVFVFDPKQNKTS